MLSFLTIVNSRRSLTCLIDVTVKIKDNKVEFLSSVKLCRGLRIFLEFSNELSLL